MRIKRALVRSIVEKDACRRELRDLRKRAHRSQEIDRKFSRSDDRPLSSEEIADIDQFWERYSFAYPQIDYKSFETFKNRCGVFSPWHIPGDVRLLLGPVLCDGDYTVPFQNKAMLGFLYPDARQPRTIVRRMNGLLYDESYRPISYRGAARICKQWLDNGASLLLKPSGKCSGRGIVRMDGNLDSAALLDILHGEEVGAYVVQELLAQSSFMRRLNDSSVNTIRITTLLHRGRVVPLAALIRVGKPGNLIDAFVQGGALVGLNMETGALADWALLSDCSRSTVLPSGVNLAESGLFVPNFDEVKEAVARMHLRVPYVRMISWDIALDDSDWPTLIEVNFAGMIQLHEAVTGPLFGDLTKEILDSCLLTNFSRGVVVSGLSCREFYDHVDVERRAGSKPGQPVPDFLLGKPVKRVFGKNGTAEVELSAAQ